MRPLTRVVAWTWLSGPLLSLVPLGYGGWWYLAALFFRMPVVAAILELATIGAVIGAVGLLRRRAWGWWLLRVSLWLEAALVALLAAGLLWVSVLANLRGLEEQPAGLLVMAVIAVALLGLPVASLLVLRRDPPARWPQAHA